MLVPTERDDAGVIGGGCVCARSCGLASRKAAARVVASAQGITSSSRGDEWMMLRRWLSLGCLVMRALPPSRASAHLVPPSAGPTGDGFWGANSSGGYGASVLLDLPRARDGLSVPVRIGNRHRVPVRWYLSRAAILVWLCAIVWAGVSACSSDPPPDTGQVEANVDTPPATIPLPPPPSCAVRNNKELIVFATYTAPVPACNNDAWCVVTTKDTPPGSGRSPPAPRPGSRSFCTRDLPAAARRATLPARARSASALSRR